MGDLKYSSTVGKFHSPPPPEHTRRSAQAQVDMLKNKKLSRIAAVSGAVTDGRGPVAVEIIVFARASPRSDWLNRCPFLR